MNQICLALLVFAFLHQTAQGFTNHAFAKVHSLQKVSSRTNSKLNAASPNRNDKEKENILFGFTDKAEKLNGRIAMSFFAVGIYEETITGKSILEQIGFTDHSQQIGALEVAAFFGLLALFPSFRKLGMKLTAENNLPDRSSKT